MAIPIFGDPKTRPALPAFVPTGVGVVGHTLSVDKGTDRQSGSLVLCQYSADAWAEANEAEIVVPDIAAEIAAMPPELQAVAGPAAVAYRAALLSLAEAIYRHRNAG